MGGKFLFFWPHFCPFLDEKYVRYRTQKWGGLTIISLSLIQDEAYNLRYSHGEEKVECDTVRLAHIACDTVCFDCQRMPSGNGKGKLSNPRRLLIQTEDLPLLSGLKVLIVDDEPGALAVTKRMLSFYQAKVIVCLSAVEGLKQLRAHRLDVIVSDIIMPHIDGYQFIQAVRNFPPDKGRDIPAVALSVLSEGEAQVKAIDAGFQKYLCKPIRFATLIGTVAGVAGINSSNARQ